MTAITLNGETQALPEAATVVDAVRAAGAPDEGHGVAVAVDGEVVPRGRWNITELREGQQVEVLRAVQGG